MPKTRLPYSPEFRRQMVDLVRAGRDPADLAREFEPTAQSISHWVAQADRQEGRREEKGGGLTAAERDELARLRRENKSTEAAKALEQIKKLLAKHGKTQHDLPELLDNISKRPPPEARAEAEAPPPGPPITGNDLFNGIRAVLRDYLTLQECCTPTYSRASCTAPDSSFEARCATAARR
jgi:transposase